MFKYIIAGLCLIGLTGCTPDASTSSDGGSGWSSYDPHKVQSTSTRHFSTYCYRNEEYLIYHSVKKGGLTKTGHECNE